MNYYELLGVDSNATSEDIKAAYKKQMKKWHPDINKDAEAVSMSMKINEAKDILLDDVKRRDYDESLNHKENNVYKKYVNKETASYSYEEPHMVTKWEYFKEYLHSDKISIWKKILSTIFVSLESAICFVLKWLIIGLAYICFTLSDIIFMLFYYTLPIIGIFTIVLIYQLIYSGYNNLINNHLIELRSLLIIVIIYISSYVFIFLGKKLISQKVFNFLYNKLDIYLFKKSVFYNL